jgi:hypothetical protein
MKKMIERQLGHYELMDWVESAATPEEMQERADHANAGYPVFVKEEVDDVAANHEPGQGLPEDQAELAASGSGYQGEEITDAEWEGQVQPPTYDSQRSLSIADKVLTIPKQCWSNALRALRRCKKQLKDAYYVEGHIELLENFFIQHGWLELPDGTIIDPTRAYLEKYHGHEPDNRTYHPLLTYTLADLKGVRGTDLPLGMIELNIWEFEHLPEQIQQTFLRGQSLEAYLTDIRESAGVR